MHRDMELVQKDFFTNWEVKHTGKIKHKEGLIWSKTALDLLFEELVKRYGPYSTWEQQHCPSKERSSEYQQFLDDFAKLVGAKSGEAVRHQVAFAIGIRTNSAHHWNQSHMRLVCLNMAAAFWAGFITNSTFPNVIATRK